MLTYSFQINWNDSSISLSFLQKIATDVAGKMRQMLFQKPLPSDFLKTHEHLLFEVKKSTVSIEYMTSAEQS